MEDIYEKRKAIVKSFHLYHLSTTVFIILPLGVTVSSRGESFSPLGVHDPTLPSGAFRCQLLGPHDIVDDENNNNKNKNNPWSKWQAPRKGIGQRKAPPFIPPTPSIHPIQDPVDAPGLDHTGKPYYCQRPTSVTVLVNDSSKT